MTLAAGVLLYTSATPDVQAAPVVPPDSCFAFDATTGMINDYGDEIGYKAWNTDDPNGQQSRDIGTCPTDVEIPSTIGGTPVEIIGSSAFNSKQLTSVIIPEGVAEIQWSSFQANQLTTLTIPSSVTNIGSDAFATNNLTSVTFLGVDPIVVDASRDMFRFNPNLDSITLTSANTTYDFVYEPTATGGSDETPEGPTTPATDGLAETG